MIEFLVGFWLICSTAMVSGFFFFFKVAFWLIGAAIGFWTVILFCIMMGAIIVMALNSFAYFAKLIKRS